MWRIDGNVASLEAQGFTARVNLLHPENGLDSISHGQLAIPDAKLLQLRMPHPEGDEQLVDSYVRGADLIAAYAQIAERQVRPQVCWRAVQCPATPAVGVELILSVQTSLLDSDPCVTIGSEVPCVEVLQLADESSCRFESVEATATEPAQIGLFLYRLPNAIGSYVEMIHPSDFHTAELCRDAGHARRIRSSFRLFAERLEKGVILLARVQGLLIAADGDETAALSCYRRFVSSAVPLTA
jgi:hypothetical protein